MAISKKKKEIKPTLNENEKLRENITSTFYWLRSNIKQFLDAYDLTQQQFSVLQILKRNNPEMLSTRQITEQMVDLNADTSRVVDRLANKGLVEKKVNTSDKRLVSVKLTKDGSKLLQKIERRKNMLDKITSGLSERQIKQLNKLLGDLRQA
jgi:DNA-binding MarR family transcriptional regulator